MIEARSGETQFDAQCDWTLAEVSRPLHSVSKLCGPMESPKHDVLFNSAKCVVVPQGVVNKILEHIKPLLQYDRKGGLYVKEMNLSGFGRQGTKA